MLSGSLLLAACDNGSADHHMAMHGPEPLRTSAMEMHDVPGFDVAKQFCSACHALPDPKAHTAAEWPGVVARMLDNMRRLGKPVPNNEQISAILDFLQGNAK